MLNEELISRLRELAKSGATTRTLINEIRAQLPDKLFNNFSVVVYLFKAFHLPLRTAREVEGSKCFVDPDYEDDEVDRIIIPQIAEHRYLWDNQLSESDNVVSPSR